MQDEGLIACALNVTFFQTFRALGCQFGAVKLIDRLLWKVVATDGYTFIANFYMFIEQ